MESSFGRLEIKNFKDFQVIGENCILFDKHLLNFQHAQKNKEIEVSDFETGIVKKIPFPFLGDSSAGYLVLYWEDGKFLVLQKQAYEPIKLQIISITRNEEALSFKLVREKILEQKSFPWNWQLNFEYGQVMSDELFFTFLQTNGNRIVYKGLLNLNSFELKEIEESTTNPSNNSPNTLSGLFQKLANPPKTEPGLIKLQFKANQGVVCQFLYQDQLLIFGVQKEQCFVQIHSLRTGEFERKIKFPLSTKLPKEKPLIHIVEDKCYLFAESQVWTYDLTRKDLHVEGSNLPFYKLRSAQYNDSIVFWQEDKNTKQVFFLKTHDSDTTKPIFSDESSQELFMGKHFQTLRENKADADIIFVVADQKFGAHKCILKAHKALKNLLESPVEFGKKEITIHDVTPYCFKAILDSAYLIKVSLDEKIAIELFDKAHQYLPRELKEQAENFLCKGINLANVESLLKIQEKTNASSLKEALSYFVAKNKVKIEFDVKSEALNTDFEELGLPRKGLNQKNCGR